MSSNCSRSLKAALHLAQWHVTLPHTDVWPVSLPHTGIWHVTMLCTDIWHMSLPCTDIRHVSLPHLYTCHADEIHVLLALRLHSTIQLEIQGETLYEIISHPQSTKSYLMWQYTINEDKQGMILQWYPTKQMWQWWQSISNIQKNRTVCEGQKLRGFWFCKILEKNVKNTLHCNLFRRKANTSLKQNFCNWHCLLFKNRRDNDTHLHTFYCILAIILY